MVLIVCDPRRGVLGLEASVRAAAVNLLRQLEVKAEVSRLWLRINILCCAPCYPCCSRIVCSPPMAVQVNRSCGLSSTFNRADPCSSTKINSCSKPTAICIRSDKLVHLLYKYLVNLWSICGLLSNLLVVIEPCLRGPDYLSWKDTVMS